MSNPFTSIEDRLVTIEELLVDLTSRLEKVTRKAPDADQRLTRFEVASLIGISLPTLHKCMADGLPFHKVGRKTIFKKSEVEKYFSKK